MTLCYVRRAAPSAPITTKNPRQNPVWQGVRLWARKRYGFIGLDSWGR